MFRKIGTILFFVLISLRLFGLIISSENTSDIFSSFGFYAYTLALLFGIIYIKESWYGIEEEDE
jgi:hypothetical protein